MCYSARVRQDLNTLIRKFGATVDREGFELLFRRRLEDGSIKLSRALEDNFIEPPNPIAQKPGRTCTNIARLPEFKIWGVSAAED